MNCVPSQLRLNILYWLWTIFRHLPLIITTVEPRTTIWLPCITPWKKPLTEILVFYLPLLLLAKRLIFEFVTWLFSPPSLKWAGQSSLLRFYWMISSPPLFPKILRHWSCQHQIHTYGSTGFELLIVHLLDRGFSYWTSFRGPELHFAFVELWYDSFWDWENWTRLFRFTLLSWNLVATQV